MLKKQIAEVKLAMEFEGVFDASATTPGPQVAYKTFNTLSVSAAVNTLFWL